VVKGREDGMVYGNRPSHAAHVKDRDRHVSKDKQESQRIKAEQGACRARQRLCSEKTRRRPALLWAGVMKTSEKKKKITHPYVSLTVSSILLPHFQNQVVKSPAYGWL